MLFALGTLASTFCGLRIWQSLVQCLCVAGRRGGVSIPALRFRQSLVQCPMLLDSVRSLCFSC